jgi:hypothetical protein
MQANQLLKGIDASPPYTVQEAIEACYVILNSRETAVSTNEHIALGIISTFLVNPNEHNDLTELALSCIASMPQPEQSRALLNARITLIKNQLEKLQKRSPSPTLFSQDKSNRRGDPDADRPPPSNSTSLGV